MTDRLKGALLLSAGFLVVGGVANGSLPIWMFWNSEPAVVA